MLQEVKSTLYKFILALSIRNTTHKKRPKICTGFWVSAAKIYLYHSTEIAKARPRSEGISWKLWKSFLKTLLIRISKKVYKKYHAQKIPKIYTGCRVSAAKIYLYHSTKIAKAMPHSEEWQTNTSVQKQWSMHKCTVQDI